MYYMFSLVPGGGVKMMPCKDGEERQGWVRDKNIGLLVATTTYFQHRYVLEVKGRFLSYILTIQESRQCCCQ